MAIWWLYGLYKADPLLLHYTFAAPGLFGVGIISASMNWRNSTRIKADLLLFMVAVIWGTAFVAQGVAGRYGVAYLFNGTSFTLAGLILIPFVPKARMQNSLQGGRVGGGSRYAPRATRPSPPYRDPKKTRETRISKEQWKWMWIAGLILFFATAMQQVGLYYTKVANASFLTSLYAVFTPFFLWIGFRERPHWLEIFAVTLAGLGAFFLSTSGKFQAQPGDLIELGGSLFWALHFVVLGKFASKFESISFASGQFIINGLINLMIGLFIEDVSILFALPLIIAILYRATLSVGIGYTLQVWGQKHTPPTDAALILGLEAVFAVIAAWLLLDESLVWIQILGCVLIFIAVLISQFKEWTSGKIDHDHLVEGR